MLFQNSNKVLLMTLIVSCAPCFSADDVGQLFHGESVRVLESAYKNAPKRVYRIVDSLLGKKEGPGSYPFNYAIFNGEPGVGKSILALAVAYKLQWDAQRYGVHDFMIDQGRNSTAAAFNAKMSQFEHCNEGTVVIVEEFNHLLMNYDSKNHDTDASSVSLWLFLDTIKSNKNIFFIGTTNGIGGFPPQLESRLKASIVTIKADHNLAHIKERLLEGLADEKVIILDETKQYLNEYVSSLQGHNARDIQHLIYEIWGQADELSEPNSDDDKLVIKPEHVAAAFRTLEEVRLQFKEKPYKETETEQRERHHQESLAQGNRQFSESLAQSNRQFLISTVLNNIMNIVNLVTNIYFNRSMHIHATEVQRSLHNDMMDAQKNMHQDILGNQKSLHTDALQHQQSLHEDALRHQQILHHDALHQQQDLHDQTIAHQVVSQFDTSQQQQSLHQDALQHQQSLHDKMIAHQTTSQTEALNVQKDLHKDAILTQTTLHAQTTCLQVASLFLGFLGS